MKAAIMLLSLLSAFSPAVVAETQSTHVSAPVQRWTSGKSALPLVFEPNRGQAEPQVRYIARGDGFTLFLTDDEAVLSRPGNAPVCMPLARGTGTRHIEAVDPTGGVSNYLIGNDSAKWRTDIPHYRRVLYHDVYPGIDEAFYGDNGQLEYDFIVRPGADPSLITMDYSGARSLHLAKSGDLRLGTATSEVSMHRPNVYQLDDAGRRVAVNAAFRLAEHGRVMFTLARYDRRRTLIIDPSLSYATYLGGPTTTAAAAIAVDNAGNAYVAGNTSSATFPTSNPLPSSPGVNQDGGGLDAFVSKMNPAGTALIYSTYLGGSGQDEALALAVDGTGAAYLTGVTASSNFPVQNPLQPTLKGAENAFIVKLNASGSGFVYSTYLGGNGNDIAYALALDTSGNVTVAGSTTSTTFPTANAIQSAFAAPLTNAFVTRLSSDGSRLLYSTYLGGGLGDDALGVAVDAAGSAYVVGRTGSPAFPLKNPINSALKGQFIGFVSKISSAGALVYSTFLGGSVTDEANAVAVDAQGEAYVTGYTLSHDFPTASALFPAFVPPGQGASTPQNAFLTKLNAAGSGYVYSTYLPATSGTAIAIDASNAAYVTGGNLNLQFPLKNALQANIEGSSDMFVTIFSPDAQSLTFSTNLGGSDAGSGIALDAAGNVYLTGSIGSQTLPSDSSAFQTTLKGNTNAFIVKLSTASNIAATVNSASFAAGAPVAPNSIASVFGKDLANQTLSATGTLGTSLGGTTVNVTDANSVTTPAQIFFASSGQVNLLIPAGIATGQGQVQVTSGDGTITVGPLSVATIAPGIFTADGKVAVGQAQQVDAHGNQTFTNLAQYNSQTGQFSGTPINLAAASSTYLILYGTGIRDALLSQVTMQIGNQTVTPAYAGIQGTDAGLDQINVQIPQSLAGSGDTVITLTAGGSTSNAVHVMIQ